MDGTARVSWQPGSVGRDQSLDAECLVNASGLCSARAARVKKCKEVLLLYRSMIMNVVICTPDGSGLLLSEQH